MTITFADDVRIHQLKTWPEYFDAVERGDKRFEIRENDREYKVGDYLLLLCWNPHTKSYVLEDESGIIKQLAFRIGYMTDFLQRPGHVVLSLSDK